MRCPACSSDDTRVIEVLEQANLALESLDLLSLGSYPIGIEHLESCRLVQRGVVDPEDDPERSSPDLLENLVLTEEATPAIGDRYRKLDIIT